MLRKKTDSKGRSWLLIYRISTRYVIRLRLLDERPYSDLIKNFPGAVMLPSQVLEIVSSLALYDGFENAYRVKFETDTKCNGVAFFHPEGDILCYWEEHGHGYYEYFQLNEVFPHKLVSKRLDTEQYVISNLNREVIDNNRKAEKVGIGMLALK